MSDQDRREALRELALFVLAAAVVAVLARCTSAPGA